MRVVSVAKLLLTGIIVAQALFTPCPAAPRSGNSPSNCSLTVDVEGFRSRKGVVGCAVFQSPAGWPEDDDKAYTRAAVPISGDTVALSFKHVPPGRYGVVCLDDENANHRLDRNLFRVPKEGFGFANNPHVAFSAPSWKDASVNVGCPATRIDVQLIYK
jgi:uncharacterized protein (DUF2141 family)